MFDHETNTVFFAECLMGRYPNLFMEVDDFLIENGIKTNFIPKTRNIWCRDYMPVQVGNHFVKFRYNYDKKYPWLRVPRSCYEQFDPIYSNILLDGGNVVRYGDKAILTKKVLKDNPGLKITKLERLLEAEIILVGIEPFSPIGHADGICHFLPNGSVLINDYESMPQKYYQEYHKRLVRALKEFSIELLVCAYNKALYLTEKQFRIKFPDGDDFNPAFGCFINYLEVGKVILLPKFEIQEDEIALTQIKSLYSGYKVKQIDCSDLSMEGGVLNCVSWNVKL